MYSAKIAASCCCLRGWMLLWLLGSAATSQAVILVDTDNALANTTAPTGQYADSGWAYQGEYGSFLGTMIAPQYFITAQHIGVSASPTFTSTAEFNGAVDVTYTIDSSANGGQGFWNIAGTDLRIFKINETFSSYATLYTGGAEAGLEMVVFGRGGPRGAEVELSGDVKGWYHTGSDGVARWGANTVDGIVGGDLLRADFDNVLGQNESTLSVGDSGGGVFVNDGGVWKLAGINYGVDGFFDINNITGDGLEFAAALYDRDGFYQGDDGNGWALAPDSAGGMYASRISTNAAVIQNIIGVPEPGSVLMLMLGGVLMMRRRR
jgi:hypothetical protein